jgi:hypothetical protein
MNVCLMILNKSIFLCGILCAAFLMSPNTVMGEIIHHWDFDSDTIPFRETIDMNVDVKDGLLRIDVMGGDPQVKLPITNSSSIRIQARMRSGGGSFGRAEIFWHSPEEDGYSADRAAMYPLIHDDEWREYDFPISTRKGPLFIRIDTGWKRGYFEIDWLRVVEDPLEATTKQAIADLPEELTISNDELEVVFRRDKAADSEEFEVTDHRTGRAWTLNNDNAQVWITRAEVTAPDTITLTLFDHSMRQDYTSHVRIEEGGILSFDLDTDDKEVHFWTPRLWPPRIDTDMEKGRLVFCDRSGGTLLHDDDPLYYGGRDLLVYGNTSCTDMPWIGLYDEDKGDGVIMLCETPADAIFGMRWNDDKRIRPIMRWRPSMDTFRYARKFSYRFVTEGGYVEMARKYREYVSEKGLILTLEERKKNRPDVAKLIGAPIIWGSTNLADFIPESRTEGLLRAVHANAQHGTSDPKVLHDAVDMGYLTCEYDSFSDIMDGPTGFQTDDIDKTAFHARPGLGPKGGWIGEGGARYSDRSTAFALRALKTYVPGLVKKWGFNARFVDVSMAISLHEDWHPEHTFDRRQDMAYRREAFSYLKDDLGLVIGTEHGNDWGVDLVDWWEGTAGGPFYWNQQGTWNSGMHKRPSSGEDYNEKYLKFGVGYKHRIPLWQLVYGDCTVSTFYWGDSAGFHYEFAPEIATGKDLINILHATVPTLWRDQIGYGWPQNKRRFMQTYHDTCHLHKAINGAALIDHQFLSADRALQRTDYADGTVVVVNFDEATRKWDTDEGKTIHLAPHGYFVSGPKIQQMLSVSDGLISKIIETDDFREYHQQKRTQINGVEFEGMFRAFKMPDNSWQFVLEPERWYEVDFTELAGWEPGADITLFELDKNGNKRQFIQPVRQSTTTLGFSTGRDSIYVAAVPGAPKDKILIYPSDGEIVKGDQVLLSSLDENVTLRYTLDGRDVSTKSRRYDQPILLNKTCSLRVGAFSENSSLVDSSDTEYTVLHELTRTPVIKMGDEPRFVRVPLKGCEELRIRVGDAGDSCWNDRANLCQPIIRTKSGEEISLLDIDPISTYQTYGEPKIVRPDSEKKLVMEGRRFENGLELRSRADLRYSIDPDWVEFEAWVGTDDSAKIAAPHIPATVEFIIEGVTKP